MFEQLAHTSRRPSPRALTCPSDLLAYTRSRHPQSRGRETKTGMVPIVTFRYGPTGLDTGPACAGSLGSLRG